MRPSVRPKGARSGGVSVAALQRATVEATMRARAFAALYAERVLLMRRA